jgi:hypothetical protein
MAVAAALNGVATFGESFAGTWVAPFVELGTAAATAGVAAHAVHRVAQRSAHPTYRILGKAARQAGRKRDAHLAARGGAGAGGGGAPARGARHVGAERGGAAGR